MLKRYDHKLIPTILVGDTIRVVRDYSTGAGLAWAQEDRDAVVTQVAQNYGHHYVSGPSIMGGVYVDHVRVIG